MKSKPSRTKRRQRRPPHYHAFSRLTLSLGLVLIAVYCIRTVTLVSTAAQQNNALLDASSLHELEVKLASMKQQEQEVQQILSKSLLLDNANNRLELFSENNDDEKKKSMILGRGSSSRVSILRGLWEDMERSPPTGTATSYSVKQRVLGNFIPRTVTLSTQEDITLVTQVSINKFQRLLIQVRWWGGPVSAAVYLKSIHDIEPFCQFVEEHQRELAKTSFHILMENTTKLWYPHNKLRNVAMEYTETDYFLAMDVDLITPPACHAKLRKLLFVKKGKKKVLKSPLLEKLGSRTLLVLPAFELFASPSNTTTEVTEEMLPRNKKNVIDMVHNGTMKTFYAHWKQGHRPTNFLKWYNNRSDVVYPIQYKQNFEPYVLGYRHGMPRYWEAFRGFGFNKFSWFEEIDRMGYHFLVLRDFYVVHMNHGKFEFTPLKEEMHKKNKRLSRVFRKHLEKYYATKKLGNKG